MKLFTRSLHIYHIDEVHRIEMRLNMFQSFRFYWQAEGWRMAVRNFWWQMWH